jgi:hypothetical protein
MCNFLKDTKKTAILHSLKQCIYGLKQSTCEWHECLEKSLEKFGFTATHFDPCVFVHNTQPIYIAVCVDDILLFGHTSVIKKERTSQRQFRLQGPRREQNISSD